MSGFEWFFVALAFFVDLGSYGGGYNRRVGHCDYPTTSPA